MIEIIPTIVPDDARTLAARASAIRDFSSWVHIDIDDGKFTAAATWPYTEPGTFDDVDLSSAAGLDVEVHAMAEEPREIGHAFARAGATRVIGHIEGFADAGEARSALDLWRRSGAREVGLAALLHTPLPVIEPLVESCDFLVLMTIATVGTQGIPFDARGIARVEEMHSAHPGLVIAVDGGVAESNIGDLARAGASRFCVGSAIAKARDPKAAYESLKSAAENAIQ